MLQDFFHQQYLGFISPLTTARGDTPNYTEKSDTPQNEVVLFLSEKLAEQTNWNLQTLARQGFAGDRVYLGDCGSCLQTTGLWNPDGILRKLLLLLLEIGGSFSLIYYA